MSAEPIATSLLPDTAEIKANDVIVGGVSLRGLAGSFGTPLFVYDEETLRTRCREAASAFDDGVAFASKSFLCGAMARLAFEEGLCIDVASGAHHHARQQQIGRRVGAGDCGWRPSARSGQLRRDRHARHARQSFITARLLGARDARG